LAIVHLVATATSCALRYFASSAACSGLMLRMVAVTGRISDRLASLLAKLVAFACCVCVPRNVNTDLKWGKTLQLIYFDEIR